MADEISTELLAKAWLHSFEEDTGELLVYRPDDYDFAPSRRPRDGIDLRPGGELVTATPGPDDRRVRSSTTWEWRNGQLILGSDVFEVASADSERLAIRPVRPQR